jgi:FAD/FMN-containing dehydrogenase
MSMPAPATTIEARLSRADDAAVDNYLSWGRYPRAVHRRVQKVYWQDELPSLLREADAGSLLPYGLGRSYGDVCLNDGRDLIDCSGCDRILAFDPQSGVIRVEGGASLAALLAVIVPRGWFLPVTPGTKFVTVGGAIANDVHGKNHHAAGSLGCHVSRMMLYRSDLGGVVCSPSENVDLFRATIGGFGVTGVIGWAELRLKPIRGNLVEVETTLFRGLQDFLTLCRESDRRFEYTVAWVDCFSGKYFQGVFFCGNHSERESRVQRRGFSPAVPFGMPDWMLGEYSVRTFNWLYHSSQKLKPRHACLHYDPFFYPLDSVPHWNLIYGRRGLVQYQCVIPEGNAEALERMMVLLAARGHGSFLAVLKMFGSVASPGLLSFPRPGLTFALDFPMRGEPTLRLLDALDEIVLAAGGAIYAAKDARMSPRMFEASYPRWRELLPFVDVKCSSSFWRRVTGAL